MDINPHSVAFARDRGLNAHTSEAFPTSSDSKLSSYGTLLFAHVLEHMTIGQAKQLVASYLPYLREAGRVVVIVPQPAGFSSDPTHVSPVERSELLDIARANGLLIENLYSFPFPEWVGRFFRYNETVALMRKT